MSDENGLRVASLMCSNFGGQRNWVLNLSKGIGGDSHIYGICIACASRTPSFIYRGGYLGLMMSFHAKDIQI